MTIEEYIVKGWRKAFNIAFYGLGTPTTPMDDLDFDQVLEKYGRRVLYKGERVYSDGEHIYVYDKNVDIRVIIGALAALKAAEYVVPPVLRIELAKKLDEVLSKLPTSIDCDDDDDDDP